jgi:outer membrane protein, heavy metal efflux system
MYFPIPTALSVVLLVVTATLCAQDSQPPKPEPKGPLSLAEAVALSLSNNPALSVYSHEMRAADASRIRAGYLPNPEVGLEVENLPGSGSRSGADTTETTLRLSQLIELGGKRTRRLAEARLSGSLAAWEYEARRLDVLADTTLRFIEVVAAQERLALTEEATKLIETELSAVTERVRAARNSLVDQKRAEIAVARAKLDREHAKHTLLSARKVLAASWGEETPAFTVARASFFATRRPEAFGSLMARIGGNPDLARLATETRLRAQLRLARTRGIPDVTLTAGIRQFADENEWAGVFGVAVPLPLFDRGQADVYEALMLQGKTEALGRAIRVELAVRLFSTYQELSHSKTELDTMAKEILPAAVEVLKATEDGYRQGRFSYLELADARRSLIELQTQNIEAALNYHKFHAEIDRLIGTAALAPESAQNPKH